MTSLLLFIFQINRDKVRGDRIGGIPDDDDDEDDKKKGEKSEEMEQLWTLYLLVVVLATLPHRKSNAHAVCCPVCSRVQHLSTLAGRLQRAASSILIILATSATTTSCVRVAGSLRYSRE